jgi:cob(I)alamin adenosyltransferase
MKIYTKTGDEGKTSFVGGERVDKDDARITALGELDELNSAIGLALSSLNGKAQNLRKILEKIQHDIFTVGAELSWFTSKASERKLPQTTERHVYELEQYIDSFVAELPEQTAFILPNGTPASTALHFARTVCRRAERSIVVLSRAYLLNPNILRYMNRLSDLLFVMARYANKEFELKEQQPMYRYFNK